MNVVGNAVWDRQYGWQPSPAYLARKAAARPTPPPAPSPAGWTLESLAYHEAGHAIAAHFCRSLIGAEIFDDWETGPRGGRCEHRSKDGRQAVLVALAGAEACSVLYDYGRPAIEEHACRDFANAEKELGVGAGDPAFREAQDDAAAIVRAFAPAVRAVAGVLIENRKVTADEVAGIVQALGDIEGVDDRQERSRSAGRTEQRGYIPMETLQSICGRLGRRPLGLHELTPNEISAINTERRDAGLDALEHRPNSVAAQSSDERYPAGEGWEFR